MYLFYICGAQQLKIVLHDDSHSMVDECSDDVKCQPLARFFFSFAMELVFPGR